jgi:hypothetical protein
MQNLVFNPTRGDILVLTYEEGNHQSFAEVDGAAQAVRDQIPGLCAVVVVPSRVSVVQPNDAFWFRQDQDGQSRRAVYVHIGTEFFKDLLLTYRNAGRTGFFYAGDYKGLPGERRLDGILFDQFHGRITLRVSHPTFAEVPDGGYPPDFDGEVVHKVVRFAPDEPVADQPECRE